jgi:hypothetical protein
VRAVEVGDSRIAFCMVEMQIVDRDSGGQRMWEERAQALQEAAAAQGAAPPVPRPGGPARRAADIGEVALLRRPPSGLGCRPSKGTIVRTSSLVVFLAVAACGGGSATYIVSGTITTPTPDGGVVGVAGVDLFLSTNIPQTPTAVPAGITLTGKTDAQGHFSIRAQSGSYTLTPVFGQYLFGPYAVDVEVAGTDIGGQDFFSVDGSQRYLYGQLSGTAAAGLGVTIDGPVSVSITTDANGAYYVGPLQAGTYTVTPHVPAGASSYPAAAQVTPDAIAFAPRGTDFLITPQSAQAIVVVSGDAASGVVSQSFPTVVPFDSTFSAPPAPSILIYNSNNDRWAFAAQYDPSGNDGTLGGDDGIVEFFSGRPAIGSYTQLPPGTDRCWGISNSNPSVGYFSSSMTLTLTSMGPAQPGLPAGSGADGLVFYEAHGTLHVDCQGWTPYTNNPPPPGEVWFDMTF